MNTEPQITGALPKTVEGVKFHCYRLGPFQHEWRSEDGRCAAGYRGSTLSTFWASIDGKRLMTRFRSIQNAMRAAVKAVAVNQ